MATFLTTSKMNPALAARVESSVRGRRARPGAARVRRVVALARLVLLLTVAFGIYGAVTTRRRTQRELERARAELLDTVRGHAASLTPEDRGALTRADSWLTGLSAPYEGDLVSPELRAPGALAATLTRPTVYVRGPIDAFTSSTRTAEAAATSTKDALVLCLLEPPASRVEKTLLEKARIAYGGGAAMEERTVNVRRLHDAASGLPLLLPPWSERVRAAEDGAELMRLRRELERAPIERAKQAAKARLLLVAIDEPGDGRGPTELDGEHAHAARVVLVDLATSSILLRMRQLVDPSWISPAKRATYASALDGCALAFDVHESVRSRK
jgi:hypothetical protein